MATTTPNLDDAGGLVESFVAEIQEQLPTIQKDLSSSNGGIARARDAFRMIEAAAQVMDLPQLAEMAGLLVGAIDQDTPVATVRPALDCLALLLEHTNEAGHDQDEVVREDIERARALLSQPAAPVVEAAPPPPTVIDGIPWGTAPDTAVTAPAWSTLEPAAEWLVEPAPPAPVAEPSVALPPPPEFAPDAPAAPAWSAIPVVEPPAPPVAAESQWQPLEPIPAEPAMAAPELAMPATPPTLDLGPAPMGDSAPGELDEELREIFILEAEEHLAVVSAQLMALEAAPADPTALREIRRSMHTLKGAAGTMGFPVIGNLCHHLEELFELADDGGTIRVVRGPSRGLLLEATNLLERLLTAAAAGQPEDARAVADLLRRIDLATDTSEVTPVSEPRVVAESLPVVEALPEPAPEPILATAPPAAPVRRPTPRRPGEWPKPFGDEGIPATAWATTPAPVAAPSWPEVQPPAALELAAPAWWMPAMALAAALAALEQTRSAAPFDNSAVAEQVWPTPSWPEVGPAAALPAEPAPAPLPESAPTPWAARPAAAPPAWMAPAVETPPSPWASPASAAASAEPRPLPPAWAGASAPATPWAARPAAEGPPTPWASRAALPVPADTPPMPPAWAASEPSPVPVAVDPPAATEVDPRQAFVAQARVCLTALRTHLDAIAAQPTAPAPIREFKGALQTLKGAAETVELPVVGNLCRLLSDRLDQLQTVDQPTGLAVLSTPRALLAEAVAGLAGLVETYAAGQLVEADPLRDLLGKLGMALPMPAAVPTPVRGRPARPAPAVLPEQLLESREDGEGAPGRSNSLRVTLGDLGSLLNLIGEAATQRGDLDRRGRDLERAVAELGLIAARLRRVAQEVSEPLPLNGADELTGPAAPSKPAMNPLMEDERTYRSPFAAEFDELEFDRYGTWYRLGRELTEIAADLAEGGAALRSQISGLRVASGRQGQSLEEARNRLLNMRLVPMASLVPRLYRVTHETAAQLGKEIRLEIAGEQTAIDKSLIDVLADGLLHLLRNAVDHGIESPEQRRAAGKSPVGVIWLSFERQGGEAIVTVQDDGGGINLPALVERAERVGMCQPGTPIDPEEVLDLIFQPGITTKQELSQISGRGVGLDAVRGEVMRLNGAITVQTTPGQGTRFTIRLPLLLAVADVLLVRAGGQEFALPTANVARSLTLPHAPNDAQAALPKTIEVAEGTATVVQLTDMLGLPNVAEQPTMGRRKAAQAILIKTADRIAAVVVDEMLDRREIVVKRLGDHLGTVLGIAGATVLDDSRVVLLLNAHALLSGIARTGDERRVLVAPAPERKRLAMVVDDSLSVRQVLSRTLRASGWEVVAARDGVDAMEQLQGHQPDIMLVDVEMPRMDGYELLNTLRRQETGRDVPVVMITSRAAEKHRRKAFELGATAYLVKPYQTSELLGLLDELVQPTGVGRESAGLVALGKG